MAPKRKDPRDLTQPITVYPTQRQVDMLGGSAAVRCIFKNAIAQALRMQELNKVAWKKVIEKHESKPLPEFRSIIFQNGKHE